jgi:hypothetical protein
MAITGTFTADFTMFQAQVALATTALDGFEADTKNVAAELTKMENSISGTAIVQAATIAAQAVENLGGVSKLTYDELQRLGGTAQDAVEKLTALGQRVPVGIQDLANAAQHAATDMQALAAQTEATASATSTLSGAWSTAQGVLGALGIQTGISAIVAFGKSVFDTGAQIHDMSERLGISAEAVQGFKFAAEQGGSSMDAVGSAITRMNKNLTEGKASTVGALQDVGLELTDLRSLKPDEAFLAIADAIAQIPDPMEQSDVALRLFGKSAAELLPAIKNHFRQVAESADKMSTATVNSLDEAQKAIDKFENQLKIAAGGTLKFVMDNFGVVDDRASTLTKTLEDMAARVEKTAPKMQLPDPIVPPKLPADLDNINRLFKEQEEGVNKAAAAQKKYQDAVANLASVGKTWQQTLEDINPWILEDISNSIKAGASLKDLAIFYGLTEPQGRAVTAMMKEQGAVMKELAKIEGDTTKQRAEGILGLDKLAQESSQKRFKAESEGITQIEKVSAELKDFQMKQSMDTTTYQVMKIWEKADAEVKAFKGTAEQSKQYSDLVYQQAQTMQDQIYSTMKDATDVLLVDVVAAANKIKGITDDVTKQVKDAHDQLQSYAGGVKMPGWTTQVVGGQSYLTGPNGQMIQLGPHGELPDNIDAVMAGSAAAAPQLYNQPRIGTGFGSAIGGGINIYNTITQPLGTPQAIASAVGDALMNQLRSQGVRTP